jgi:hypothetical protein
LFGILPVFVRYVNSLPHGETPRGRWQALGQQRKWFALVLRGWESDAGILQHEVCHVRQWYLTTLLAILASWDACGLLVFAVPLMWPPALLLAVALIYPCAQLHGVLYGRVRLYRRWAEVGAYARQLDCYPQDDTPEKRNDRLQLFASFLALDVYRLNITQTEAAILLIAKRS